MAGKKGMVNYPVEMRIKVAEEYLAGKGSQQEIAERYGILLGRVKVWSRIYRREGPEGFHKRKGRPQKKNYTPEQELKRLSIENDLLKKALSELRTLMPVKRNIGPLKNTKKNTQSQ